VGREKGRRKSAKAADLICSSIKTKNSQQELAEIDLANFSHFGQLKHVTALNAKL
jgi:hypothetical protein